ncbi:hypothetical protein EQV77_11175 [Halobacillus fulvus]|nr:hypothetical protein EQV77_11175 [Halobacillus fulvus]
MNGSNRSDLSIILMLTIGVPLCTIVPSLQLPVYVMYPLQLIGIILIVLGLPASIYRLKENSSSNRHYK